MSVAVRIRSRNQVHLAFPVRYDIIPIGQYAGNIEKYNADTPPRRLIFTKLHCLILRVKRCTVKALDRPLIRFQFFNDTQGLIWRFRRF